MKFKFVIRLLDKIQPILRQNVLLMFNGQFMKLLDDLLKDINIQKDFHSLMDKHKPSLGIKVNNQTREWSFDTQK